MKDIPFLVVLPIEEKKDTLGLFGMEPDAKIGLKSIPIDVLKKNLTDVSLAMLDVLNDIKQMGKFKLKEVSLEVEVTAEGGVCFIGTAKLAGKGAISLRFSE